jgi:hypothetical protein
MKATCPFNKEHKTFITTAHVLQDWIVDEEGNFVSCLNQAGQTTHGPHKDNIWTCATCYAHAKVE